MRPGKDPYYISMAKTTATRSTCLKRTYGAIIVNHDRIVATGYNGAPRGRVNCTEIGSCPRMDVPNNTDYSLCRSVHAEMNAIIHANYDDCIGATLYLYGKDLRTGRSVPNCEPCPMCKRAIINAQIEKVVVLNERQEPHVTFVADWVLPCGDDSLHLKETVQHTKPPVATEANVQPLYGCPVLSDNIRIVGGYRGRLDLNGDTV